MALDPTTGSRRGPERRKPKSKRAGGAVSGPAPLSHPDEGTRGILPAEPPVPALQKHGVQLGISEVNQRVEQITDSHQRAFGRKPSPGLVFDLLRNPDVADYDELFHLPKTKRQAEAMRLVRNSPDAQDLNEEAVLARRKENADHFRVRMMAKRHWIEGVGGLDYPVNPVDRFNPTESELAEIQRRYIAQAQGGLLLDHDRIDKQAEEVWETLSPEEKEIFEVEDVAKAIADEQIATSGFTVDPGIIGTALTQIAFGVAAGPVILTYAEMQALKDSWDERSLDPFTDANVEIGKTIVKATYNDLVALATWDEEYLREHPGDVVLTAFGVASFGAGVSFRLSALSKGNVRRAVFPSAGRRLHTFQPVGRPDIVEKAQAAARRGAEFNRKNEGKVKAAHKRIREEEGREPIGMTVDKDRWIQSQMANFEKDFRNPKRRALLAEKYGITQAADIPTYWKAYADEAKRLASIEHLDFKGPRPKDVADKLRELHLNSGDAAEAITTFTDMTGYRPTRSEIRDAFPSMKDDFEVSPEDIDALAERRRDPELEDARDAASMKAAAKAGTLKDVDVEPHPQRRSTDPKPIEGKHTEGPKLPAVPTVEMLRFDNPIVRFFDDHFSTRRQERAEQGKGPYLGALLRDMPFARAGRLDKAALWIDKNFSFEAKLRREVAAFRRVEMRQTLAHQTWLEEVAGGQVVRLATYERLGPEVSGRLSVGEQRAIDVLSQGGDPIQAWATMMSRETKWMEDAKEAGAGEVAQAHLAQITSLEMARPVIEALQKGKSSKRFKLALELARRVSADAKRIKAERLGIDPRVLDILDDIEYDVYKTGETIPDMGKVTNLMKNLEARMLKLMERELPDAENIRAFNSWVTRGRKVPPIADRPYARNDPEGMAALSSNASATKLIDMVASDGKATVADEMLPRVKKGYVRLYRGEGPEIDLANAGNLPDWMTSRMGRWFTSNRDLAKSYDADNQNGPARGVWYVDVPQDVADAARIHANQDPNVFIDPDWPEGTTVNLLPEEWSSKKKSVVRKPTPAKPAALVSGRTKAEADKIVARAKAKNLLARTKKDGDDNYTVLIAKSEHKMQQLREALSMGAGRERDRQLGKALGYDDADIRNFVERRWGPTQSQSKALADLETVSKQYNTLRGRIEEFEERLANIEKRPGSFFVPLVGKSDTKARNEFMDHGGRLTRRANEFGDAAPDIALTEVSKMFDGVTLLVGDKRWDTTNLAGLDLGRVYRKAIILDDYRWRLSVSRETPPPAGDPSRRFFHPVRLPESKDIPDNVRRLLDQSNEPALADIDVEMLDDAQLDAIQGHLYPSPDKPIQGVRWYDTRLFEEHRSIPSGGWRTVSQGVNTVFGRTKIYFAPRYLLNTLSNKAMLTLDQGILSPVSMTAGYFSKRIYGEKTTKSVDAQVGSSRTRSYEYEEGESLVSRAVNQWGEVMHMLTDMHDRRASFYYHAWEKGYFSPERMDALLHDPVNAQDLAEVSRLAQKNVVEMDNMTHFERANIRHLLFVYPWRSRQFVWSIRTLAEHPMAAAAFMDITTNAQEILSESPKWARDIVAFYQKFGYVPVDVNEDGTPVLWNSTINSWSGLHDFMNFDPSNSLGVAAEGVIKGITGRDEYGNEYPGGDTEKFFRGLGDALYGYWVYRGQQVANSGDPEAELKPIDWSDRSSGLSRIKSAAEETALTPGWWDGLGIMVTGGYTSRELNTEKSMLRWYEEMATDKERLEFAKGFTREILALQGEHLKKAVPEKVAFAVDFLMDYGYEAERLRKEKGLETIGEGREKDLALIHTLEAKGLISSKEAERLDKLSKGRGSNPKDHTLFRTNLLQRYAGTVALAKWDDEVRHVASYRKDLFDSKVSRLKAQGLVSGSYKADQESLYERGRQVVRFEEERAKREEAIRQERRPRMKEKMEHELHVWLQENDREVVINGQRLPSNERLSWANYDEVDRVRALRRLAQQDWEDVTPFERQILGKPGPSPQVMENWGIVYDQMRAVEEANVDNGDRKTIPSAYKVEVGKWRAGADPDFRADWEFSQQSLAGRLMELNPIKTSKVYSFWKELLSDAKRYYDAGIKAGGTPTAIADQWKDGPAQMWMSWIEEQPESFQREINAFDSGGRPDDPDRFVERLVKP